jgi:ureidoglycolate lyase
VIEAAGTPLSINYGATARYHNLARIEAQDGRAIISLFRSSPVTLPFEIGVMENHPLGSQAFMPLSSHPYIVVVAPKGPFAAEKIEAFLAAPGQGVNFRPGTWHHYNLALEGISDFLVIDRDGAGDNCEEMTLAEPVILSEGSG